jgi:hypothetical protein
MATKREIGVVLPDRYKRISAQTDAPLGSASVPDTTVGFNGKEFLLSLEPPNDAVLARWQHGIRLEFVREILMRLPSELPGVRLSQRTTLDSGQERLAIDAFGLDDLDATLLVDRQTCRPLALEYRQASTTAPGLDTYRVELSEYRRFGGILFPTILKTAKNGEPWEDEYDSEVQVNPRLDTEYFRLGRG